MRSLSSQTMLLRYSSYQKLAHTTSSFMLGLTAMSSVNLPRSNISLKITIKGGFYSETAFLYALHSFLHFPQKTFGGYEEKSYLCRRKAALGKLKASFLCARLHFLCGE